MWSKLYLALLGLSLVVMAFLTYYSWSWLQSIGIPAGAIAGYEYHSGFAWTALWLSTTVLLLLGNAVLWASGRAWAMWTTFLYFAVLVVVKFFWLDEALFHFKKSNNFLDGSFSVGPFFAVILIALVAVIVFFDQFVVVRLYRKMYPPVVVDESETPIEPAAE